MPTNNVDLYRENQCLRQPMGTTYPAASNCKANRSPAMRFKYSYFATIIIAI